MRNAFRVKYETVTDRRHPPKPPKSEPHRPRNSYPLSYQSITPFQLRDFYRHYRRPSRLHLHSPMLPQSLQQIQDTTENQPKTSVDAVEAPPPLSKNAQKKARKAELLAERKLERRAREKEAKKEKKRKRNERIIAGEEVSDDDRTKKRAKMGGRKTPFGARVVMDLGFDDKMSDKEVASLCSQLAYTYSANRRSPTPFSSLLFTSLNGRTFTRLEGMNDAGYKRWTGTEWWSESYERLWEEREEAKEAGEAAAAEVEEDNGKAMQASSIAPKTSVVYLTADSPEELSELKEGETYIIGGICDHNRYKNLCLNQAKASGIRAVQLPVGRYLSNLPTRKVLTVNQVFEILLKWVETRDWEQALYSVIPKRKFQNGSAHVKEQGDDDDDDEVKAKDEGEEGSGKSKKVGEVGESCEVGKSDEVKTTDGPGESKNVKDGTAMTMHET
ncbi:hypothetical protein EW146_g4047 [Bondarzewia mesenterica]|uniref:tRNA (guanine(9)-N1)-methyltransferase n=1 Tax=Bondarzewia mesenterica TaxID=1095465 RepID=A0A4S4LXW5_9AGAM|nr:hypothetical protein EW146_g4047 [Bondarzewia mesenterica]